jgi:hypothetical protein
MKSPLPTSLQITKFEDAAITYYKLITINYSL